MRQEGRGDDIPSSFLPRSMMGGLIRGLARATVAKEHHIATTAQPEPTMYATPERTG